MIVSDVWQNDPGIHIHVSILFQILFPFRLLHNIEQSSLCSTQVISLLIKSEHVTVSKNDLDGIHTRPLHLKPMSITNARLGGSMKD